MDYKNAGVDIEAGYRSVELMKKHVQGTMRPEVLTDLGGFSGAFSMERFKDMEKPTLVSGTDGVGTKLKLAFLLDQVMIPWESTVWQCASTILPVQAANRCFSWTILPAAKMIRRRSQPSSAVWQRAANSPALP